MDEPVYDARVYRALLEDVSLAVVVHGPDGKIVEANQAFADMLGYSRNEVRHLSAADVIHPAEMDQRDADAAMLIGGERRNLSTERRLIRKDGAPILARVHKTGLHHEGRTVVMVIIEDWTDQHAQWSELTYAAHHDGLTGVLNRSGLQRYLEGARRDPVVLLVTMIDVDGLKEINDVHGHAVGDQLLQAVAQSFTAIAAPGWAVARLSGDEFAIVAPIGDADDAVAMRRKIRGAIAEPLLLPDARTVVPTVSIGTAILPSGGTIEEALRQADAAMYRHKHHHRGTHPPPADAAVPSAVLSPCFATVLLSDRQRAELEAAQQRPEDPAPHRENLSWVHGCQLDHDHPGAHYALAVSISGSDYWLRWDEAGVTTIGVLPPCAAWDHSTVDRTRCRLFDGHAGGHRPGRPHLGGAAANVSTGQPGAPHAHPVHPVVPGRHGDTLQRGQRFADTAGATDAHARTQGSVPAGDDVFSSFAAAINRLAAVLEAAWLDEPGAGTGRHGRRPADDAGP